MAENSNIPIDANTIPDKGTDKGTETSTDVKSEVSDELLKLSPEELAKIVKQTRSEAADRRVKNNELQTKLQEYEAKEKEIQLVNEKIENEKLLASKEFTTLIDKQNKSLEQLRTESETIRKELNIYKQTAENSRLELLNQISDEKTKETLKDSSAEVIKIYLSALEIRKDSLGGKDTAGQSKAIETYEDLMKLDVNEIQNFATANPQKYAKIVNSRFG